MYIKKQTIDIMIKPSIFKIKNDSQHIVLKKTTAFWNMILVLILLGAGLNACSDGGVIDDDPIKGGETGLTIKNKSIPSSVNVAPEAEITLMGQGFENGDKIRLVLLTDSEKSHFINISTVTGDKVTFSLPKGVISGKYSVTLYRGTDSLLLGSITINIVIDSSIPDIDGMTIKGVVTSEDKGVEGVVVSDGYEVTTTNAEGIYYLPSTKKNKYVFISVPGNYEVSNKDNLPIFFQRLSGGSSVEQKDFSLITSRRPF